jgi:LPXTG-motif cell wall-anchored protein
LGSTKRVLATVVLGVAVVFALGAGAGAQTTTTTATAPPSPGPCTFSVTPSTIAANGTSVTVSGTAPVGVTVQVFVNGAAVAGKSAVVPAGGAFSFTVTANINDNVSVNYTYGNKNAYTTGCATALGETVVKVLQASGSTALPFTGSSDTTNMLLIAGFALVVGTVLVVGGRRRSAVRS